MEQKIKINNGENCITLERYPSKTIRRYNNLRNLIEIVDEENLKFMSEAEPHELTQPQ